MAQVHAEASRLIPAPPERVFEALTDYEKTRPASLPAALTDYRLIEGGTGAGTRYSYRLHATNRRVREVDADVTVPSPGREVVEADRSSTLRVRFLVEPGAGEGSQVRVSVDWAGAGGIGGLFEGLFAPKRMSAIYEDMLGRLAAQLA